MWPSRASLQHVSTTMDSAPEEPGPGGFGMLIARHVADELVYNEHGNEVILIKHIDQMPGVRRD